MCLIRFLDRQGYFAMARVLLPAWRWPPFLRIPAAERPPFVSPCGRCRRPKPALKYQLLPEVRELKPGNAAQNYLKCFMEQRYFFFTKEAAAERARYQTMPLGRTAGQTSCATTVAQHSGRRTGRPGWIRSTGRLSSASRTAEWKRLSDELGPLQDLAAALHVPVSSRGGRAHFDDAIRTAKTMFALGRHLGEHPTEVG